MPSARRCRITFCPIKAPVRFGVFAAEGELGQLAQMDLLGQCAGMGRRERKCQQQRDSVDARHGGLGQDGDSSVQDSRCQTTRYRAHLITLPPRSVLESVCKQLTVRQRDGQKGVHVQTDQTLQRRQATALVGNDFLQGD